MGTAGLVCLLAVSTTGCSSADPGSAGNAGERTAPLTKSEDLHLPIEKYLFSNAETVRLEKGRFALIGKCLRRLGLGHGIESPGPAPGPRNVMERRYGISDLGEAKVNGYRLGDTGTPPPRSLAAQLDSLSGAEKTQLTSALHGEADPASAGQGGLRVNGVPVPVGGCAGEATGRIAGGTTGHTGPSEVARRTNFESFDASRSDARVVRALGSWSRCMKEKGYAYPDPLAAMSDPAFQGKSPTPKERDVAQADIRCKRSTNLIGIWFDVEAALQKSMIEKKGPDFSAALKAKNGQLARAASALGDR
ncbi:hypothetical protein Sfulv_33590 [Streptomyces fulvorobeus]|nr:hypothetical protein Sfulv_33590 [Streptomyces fulvorobeus]